jgi:hypothetical protein
MVLYQVDAWLLLCVTLCSMPRCVLLRCGRVLRMAHEVLVTPSLSMVPRLTPSPNDLHRVLLRIDIENVQVNCWCMRQ